jgi:hypothetical protein
MLGSTTGRNKPINTTYGPICPNRAGRPTTSGEHVWHTPSSHSSRFRDSSSHFCICTHSTPHTQGNHGYDDDRGDYIVVPHDHLAYRYEVLGILGKGSFGQVVKVHDFKTNMLRAVKIIRNKKRFHHQVSRWIFNLTGDICRWNMSVNQEKRFHHQVRRVSADHSRRKQR